MVFIVSPELQEKDSLAVKKGDRATIFRELLAEPSADVCLLPDDYQSQSEALSYLGLDYKAVISVPDLPSPTALLYERDQHRLIDYENFKKIFVEKQRPTDHVEELDDKLGINE